MLRTFSFTSVSSCILFSYMQALYFMKDTWKTKRLAKIKESTVIIIYMYMFCIKNVEYIM